MDASSRMFEIIDLTLKESGNKLTVTHLCELAHVSRSGYYAWVNAKPARDKKEEQDQKDFELILEGFKHRGYTKGARGIKMYLERLNPPVIMSREKITRLMHKFRLVCPIRRKNAYRKLMQELRTNNVSPNLVQREFEKYGPRMILLTDITYLPYNGRFAYLSVILDAFTKEVLAYVVSDSLEEDFVLETVNNLVRDQGILLSQDTVIHSDQGSHYTSVKFIDLVRDSGLRKSMSRKGNCWDNAPIEGFFGRMKDHISPRLKECKTFDEVKAIIDDYMGYYNHERPQWELAKLTPSEYYMFYYTGVYPLVDVANPPEAPKAEKPISELGANSSNSTKTDG